MRFKKIDLLSFTLYLRAISKYKPWGVYIWRGDLMEGFSHYEFGGIIFGGAYFRNLQYGKKKKKKQMSELTIVAVVQTLTAKYPA